jgi:LexA-binding, inner membrane-associated putative hydrolase
MGRSGGLIGGEERSLIGDQASTAAMSRPSTGPWALVRGASRRTDVLAAAAVAVVAGADWVIRYRTPRWIMIAAFDHPAHLATAGLVALNLPPRSATWHAGFMAGALLPDADHVPLALAKESPGPMDSRPATHCAAAAVPLFALARASGSDVVSGAAWGTLAHLARDIAIGPGVPLWSPMRRDDVRVPYPLYAGALAVLALTAVRAGRAGEPPIATVSRGL